MPTVAVVAPRLAARRRLAASLRAAGLAVAADVATSKQLSAERLDFIVLHSAGTEVTAELRLLLRRFPSGQIICVTNVPAWKTVRGLLRDGATAVVAEEDVDAALTLAIMNAQAGQLSVPSRLRAEIARPVLSVREKQMLAMVVMGFSNAEISRKLYIAESTVKSHLSSAFAKLGVRSRNEATALILDPESGLGAGILTIDADDSNPNDSEAPTSERATPRPAAR